MPIKIELEKITTTKVEAELPDECPNCGADFTDPEELNLREDGYTAGSQNCCISDDGEHLDEYDAGDFYYEAGIVTGYRCACCDHVLASTEESGGEVQEGTMAPQGKGSTATAG
jgi:hypothetical protein